MLVHALTAGMRFYFIVIVCSIGLLSFMAWEDPLQQLLQKQDAFRKKYSQEKIHLHTDKSYYSTGDTVYFKAYVLNAAGNLPSEVSRVLHVDMIDERETVVESALFPVEDGTARGTTVLSDSLREGSYTIRAYTNWMRNFDEAFFYKKTILVGNALSSDIVMHAEFSFQDDNGQVRTKLTYRHLQGQSLASKQVSYSIRTPSREWEKGSVQTDDSGSIMIQSTKLAAGFSGDLVTLLKPGDKQTVTKIISLQTPATGTGIRFFPESGQLVNGLRSRVGFKAISADGLGAAVSGDIVDQNGSKLTSFVSGFAGTGSFDLIPVAGKAYHAIVRFRDGKEKKVPLPQAAEQGYVLSADNSQPEKIAVTIAANQAASGAEVVLVALSNNTVRYAGKMKLTGSATASSMLSKKRFPSGILQLTLFDAGYRPVAERLVFIRQDDQLSLQLSTPGKTYRSREKVKLSLHATDADGNDISGSFSVSVTDESKVPFREEEEQTIFSNMLLGSDIRGYIQSPNYYFTSVTPQKEKELDDLLLTQGWRRFAWSEVLADKQPALSFEAEKGLSVSGRVTTLKGEPVPNGKILLLSKSGKGFIIDTTAGADGRFCFDLPYADSMNFSLQAQSSTGSNQVKIELDDHSSQKVGALNNGADATLLTGASFTTYLQNSHRRFQEMSRYTNLKGAATLKPVLVATTKLTKVQEAVKGSWNLNGPGHADQVLTYLDLDKCNDIAMCLQGKMLGVVVRQMFDPVTKSPRMLPFSTRGTGGPMLIVVDGMITYSPSLGDIPASDVQSIEILRSGSYLPVYGTKGAQGVMVITTKSGSIAYNEAAGSVSGFRNGNTVFSSSQGYAAAREFYSPDYSATAKAGAMQDLRSTIYWKPDVITDEDGNASVEFYNADGPGSYKVIVEGISADGKLGRQQYRYEVR